MKRWPELLPNAIGIVIALVVTCFVVGILLRSGDAVPWQLWATIVAVLVYVLALVATMRWIDWKNRRK